MPTFQNGRVWASHDAGILYTEATNLNAAVPSMSPVLGSFATRPSTSLCSPPVRLLSNEEWMFHAPHYLCTIARVHKPICVGTYGKICANNIKRLYKNCIITQPGFNTNSLVQSSFIASEAESLVTRAVHKQKRRKVFCCPSFVQTSC